MAHLIELDGVRPTIGEDVSLAPTAVEDYQELRRRYLAADTETVAPR
jgi:hypothetical protein